MALQTTHKFVSPEGEETKTTFGVGDVVRVHQRLTEAGGKSRVQIFEGQVIAIRGREMGKNVIVRRIGAQSIGMEMIFPLFAPTIEKVEVKREGVKGTRHAKLYFTRAQSHKEIEKIYRRIHTKDVAPVAKKKKAAPKKASK